MRALALALLVLLVVLPSTAHAQVGLVPPQLSVTIEDPGRALTPGQEGVLNVLVNYNPGTGGRPMVSPSEEYNNTEPTRITFAVKQQPSWVTAARFEPAELLVEVPAAASRVSRYVQLIVNVSPEAPALQREDIVVTAHAEPNGNIAEGTGESPAIQIRPSVVSVVNVTAETPSFVAPGGRWIKIPYVVRNDGNGPVDIALNVTLRPEESQIAFEREISLERGESRVVEVELRLPWTTGQPGVVELEAVPMTENDDGRAVRAQVDVNGQSAVPAPSVGLLAALLAGVALARRHRPL